MPHAPARICPQCSKPFTGRGCPTCRKPWAGTTRSYAGSGSTRRWRVLRAKHLDAHPICQRPGCSRLARDVDHIVNVANGGDRYDEHNLQSLCPPHHTEKTQREAQAGRKRNH